MTLWAKFNRHSNLPNGLSLLRALLGLIIPFLFIAKSPALHITAAILFTFAAITDYWDGWLARKQGLESNFGKILDPTSDKILILLSLAAFAYVGYYSPWWLVPVFFREIVITFCRIGWLLEGKAAGAEKLGKVKLVFQVVLVASAFFESLTYDFSALFGFQSIARAITLGFLILINILTLVSGWTFVLSNRALFKTPDFAKFVSAAGVGLLPGITGTWGSLLALCFIPFLAWNQILYWGIFIFLFWASYWAVNRLDLTKVKDPQFVVMDEVLGIFITFAFVPLSAGSLLAGFFLFRLFDIFKPFPCRQLEKLPGFWGITLDDLGAGLYSCLLLHFFFRG